MDINAMRAELAELRKTQQECFEAYTEAKAFVTTAPVGVLAAAWKMRDVTFDAWAASVIAVVRATRELREATNG
jgi:hypothetical protein